MTAAVAIQNVHKRFGGLHALKGLEFDIQPGEFFGLLGPNGAGKSTLISIMAGLVRASAGSVAVMGHDVVRDFRHSRQALGVVPQELVYDPFFTVWELLKLQSGYFGFGRANDAWIDELLATLNLTDKADANMHDLSGGMKRRALIAQALVHRPPVVVLDEPTAGVDVELRQALWQFTRRLHEEGRTIILTTHYLEEAEALCERIAVINEGEMVALDSKHGLLARQPYWDLVLTTRGEAPTLPETLEALVTERRGERLVLRLHRRENPIGDVLEGLRTAGVAICELYTHEPGLEEVFLELTAKGGRR